MGEGEDNMIVGYGQFGGTLRQPSLPGRGLAFGAVAIAARVVRDDPLSAAITLFDVPPRVPRYDKPRWHAALSSGERSASGDAD